MSEAEPLVALGATPESIWGDEDETIVYVQALGKGRAFIFRFLLSPDRPSQSLPNRIVNCYHDIDVPSEASTFADRGDMRRAVWSAVAKAWPDCINDPAALELGAIVDLASNDAGEITWRVYQDPLFQQYLNLMENIQPSDLSPRGQSLPTVDISEVAMLQAMGGRGCCKQVRLQADTESPHLFVFKGIDFQTYLQLHDEDDGFARAMVETWRRSSKLIADMPPHPNIQSPPKMLLSISGQTLVGHLSTFFTRGALSDVIATANESKTRIPLQKKAKWCHQMSLAIAHTHTVMHTFHMDIKPGNFIVDDQENLLLIDWEQSGAPATTLAPEADGTWDVKQEGARLVYTKYVGPERRNMPEGGGQETFNIWNVFPVWQASCPRATELAEVFALGRTMWMLLSQVDDDFDEVQHPDDVRVAWAGNDDIPAGWIEMAERCMDRDPNKRPAVVDLADFWKAQESRLGSST